MSSSNSESRHHPMPFTRIEVVVLSIIEKKLHVLEGRRQSPPHAAKWALPGGALRIDLDKSLEDAADRVIAERLQTRLPMKRQLCALGGPLRDPRDWSLSIVYWALLPHEMTKEPVAGKRIEALRWVPAEDATKDTKLAFDHAQLIDRAVNVLRHDIDTLDLPFEFLPAQFTLGDLQEACEALLGKNLDKSSFRRRLASSNILEAIKGQMKLGAFRPAQVYRARIRN